MSNKSGHCQSGKQVKRPAPMSSVSSPCSSMSASSSNHFSGKMWLDQLKDNHHHLATKMVQQKNQISSLQDQVNFKRNSGLGDDAERIASLQVS